jgi:hypothetical protein
MPCSVFLSQCCRRDFTLYGATFDSSGTNKELKGM